MTDASSSASVERERLGTSMMVMDRWHGITLVLLASLQVAATVFIVGSWFVRDEFDINLPPPSGQETYAEVLPGRIAGIDAAISAWPSEDGKVRGARARYGDRATVEIVRSEGAEALDKHVQAQVQPRLSGYKRNTGGKKAGRWRLCGHQIQGGGRLYAWQSGDWMFVIEAASDEVFDEVVDRFAYIRRR